MSQSLIKDEGMLILIRGAGEAIVIGDKITLTVLGVDDNQVKIGTKAPRRVPVHREEVYRRIHGEPPKDARTSLDVKSRSNLTLESS